MIAKELDDVTIMDKRRAADHAAEVQLAFYFEGGFELSSAEMAGLASFSKSRHRALEQVSPTPESSSPVTIPTLTLAEPISICVPDTYH